MHSAFHFIIYVKDQKKSVEFYKKVLRIDPFLDVPGMTEFKLSDNTIFGIIPEKGISSILENKIIHADKDSIRCELYIVTENPFDELNRFKKYGGNIISEVKKRNWGCSVGYGKDIDGNIIAFSD